MKRREFNKTLIGGVLDAGLAASVGIHSVSAQVRSTAEGLRDPKSEILPITKYLAGRGKVHQVHMRNIRGGLYDFAEVYPDEGDVDFFQVMRILRDTQFAFSICADHMPSHPDDPGKLQAFAYGNGYIRALIHSVNAEVAVG